VSAAKSNAKKLVFGDGQVDKAGGQAHQEHRDPFLMVMGDRVRMMRARCGLTRRGLANQAGVSERYLARLENGAGNASMLLLRQLTKPLNCTLENILGDKTTLSPEWSRIRDLLSDKDAQTLKLARISLEILLAASREDS
jgi:XRE family transcriptional regulator, aerobic/anaerobic benzoate catabolism transcriptional regulator